MKTVVAGLMGSAAMFGAVCACMAATFTTPIEASRYRTSDGVEVITGRSSALPSTAVMAAPQVAPAAKVREASEPPMLHPVSMPVAKPAQVPAEEQASRDKDRINILTSELINEGKALEKKRAALRSPKVDAELSTEQQQALREEIARHEANVKALNAELRRAGSQTRVGAANS